jgi:hypothetical protein
MDKLEPILKQKFWIILGLGLIMTIAGWWMGTGSLAATITARRDAIKKAEDAIPSGDVPNDDWSNKLSQINVRQETMVSQVRRALWQRQAATYFWPQNVEEFAKDVPYRSEFNLTARELYRTYYPGNAEEVWMRVRPIRVDGTGIVVFPYERMPQKTFGELAPRSDEIWDAQEDLWLLVPILDAVREVNGGEAGTRLDAVVHVIDRLELMGGERQAGEGGAAASGTAMGMGMDAGAMSMAGSYESAGSSGANFDMNMNMGGMGSAMGAGGKVATPTPKVPADFSFQEEFGGSGVAGGGGGGGYFGDMGSAMPAEGDGGSMASPTAPTVRRYIDEADNLPYKTRGFYISVVMDHRKVPNLIGELTANGVSPWPIEIVRLQISRVNDDDTEGRNLGLGGMTAGTGFNNPLGGGAFAGEAGSGGVGFPETGIDPSGGFAGETGDLGYGGTTPAVPGGLSLEAALSDPFMARVALAGLIYLYKPVDLPPPEAAPAADPAAAAGETAPAPAEGTTPQSSEATPAPTEATPTPEPSAAPTSEQPAATPPASPQPGVEAPTGGTDPAAPTPAAPVPN